MNHPTLLLAAATGLFTNKTGAQSIHINWPVQPLSACDGSPNDPLQWNDGATYNPFGVYRTAN